MMKKIGIFCGAKNGNSEKIKSETVQLVSLFAKSNFDLVYGGSSKGLMGTVAKIFRENNRQVIGVLPYKKLKTEKPSQLLSQSIYVDNLFERKQKMIALSDVFLVLPGGLGTLDETLDVIANNRMNFTNKKITVFNCHHFFDGLICQIDKMIALNFLSEKIKDELIIESDVAVVFERLGV